MGKRKGQKGPPYPVQVLELITAAQAQHGARGGDYERYRQYCTRRVRRLRVSLKYTHPRRFANKPVEASKVTESRFLFIPLFLAERAWAQAMSVKQEISEENIRPRHHVIRRLSKAAKWADELHALCGEISDTHSQLQAEGYATWMRANLLLEREQWTGALQLFSRAKLVFDKLGRISDPEVRELCEQRSAQMDPSIRYCKYLISRISGASGVDATALLELELEDGLNELLHAKLESVLAEQRQNQAKTLGSVTWKDETLAFKNSKLRVCIIEAQQHQKQIELTLETPLVVRDGGDGGDGDGEEEETPHLQSFPTMQAAQEHRLEVLMSVFGKLLTSYDSAMSHVVADRRKLDSSYAVTAKNKLLDNFNRLEEYIACQKLQAVQQRNSILASTYRENYMLGEQGKSGVLARKTRPIELVNLYFKMIQNAFDIADLSSKDKAGSAKDRRSDTMSAEALLFDAASLETLPDDVATQTQLLRAHYAYFLAESTRKDSEWAQAYVLFEHARQIAGKAARVLAETDAEAAQEARSVAEDAEAKKLIVHVSGASTGDEEEEDDDDEDDEAKQDDGEDDGVRGSDEPKLLLERLDSFDAGKRKRQMDLVEFPPSYMPTPCRPVLFDLAFNFIQFPDLSGRYTAEKPKEEPAKSGGGGGWFGWMRGS